MASTNSDKTMTLHSCEELVGVTLNLWKRKEKYYANVSSRV